MGGSYTGFPWDPGTPYPGNIIGASAPSYVCGALGTGNQIDDNLGIGFCAFSYAFGLMNTLGVTAGTTALADFVFGADNDVGATTGDAMRFTFGGGNQHHAEGAGAVFGIGNIVDMTGGPTNGRAAYCFGVDKDYSVVGGSQNTTASGSNHLAVFGQNNDAKGVGSLWSGKDHTFTTGGIDYGVVCGFGHDVYDSDYSAVFGLYNTLGWAAEYNLVAGKGHTLYESSRYNVVGGEGHTMTTPASYYSAIFGEGHALSGFTHGIVAGYNHNLSSVGSGAVARQNAVFGNGQTLSVAGTNAIVSRNIIAGLGHSITAPGVADNASDNAVFGAYHMLTDASYNLVGGNSHILPSGCDYNAIGGYDHTLGTSATNNSVSGQSHTIASAADNNVVGGAANDIAGDDNAVFGQANTLAASLGNGIFGYLHDVSSGCDYNVIGGDDHTLAGSCTHNAVFGDAHVFSGAATHNLLSGYGHTLPAAADYNVIGGYDHTLTVGKGGPGYNAVFGFGNTIAGDSNDNVVCGRSIIASGIGSAFFGSNYSPSAGHSVIGGQNHNFTGSATSSGIFGESHTISSSFMGLVVGYSHTVDKVYACVAGKQVRTRWHNAMYNSSGPIASGLGADGDTQQIYNVPMMLETNDDSAHEMFIDPSSSYRLTIEPESAILFDILLLAKRRDVEGHEKSWNAKATLRRTAAGVVSLVSAVTPTIIDDTGESWTVAVTADDTNKSLKIAVTGSGTDEIYWNAMVRAVETLTVN
jgi:hypothetical protein